MHYGRARLITSLLPDLLYIINKSIKYKAMSRITIFVISPITSYRHMIGNLIPFNCHQDNVHYVILIVMLHTFIYMPVFQYCNLMFLINIFLSLCIFAVIQPLAVIVNFQ